MGDIFLCKLSCLDWKKADVVYKTNEELCDYEVERLKQNKEQFQTNIEICISSLSIIHCADGIQQEPQ